MVPLSLFHPPHTGNIHARSDARAPFPTVSEGVFWEVCYPQATPSSSKDHSFGVYARPYSKAPYLLCRERGGRKMDTEEQDFLSISSGKDAKTTSPPPDTLAKTLADGTISRGQALKLMGAAGAVAS